MSRYALITVQELIDNLNKIDKKDQPVVAWVKIASDFEFGDGTPAPTEQQFQQVITRDVALHTLFDEPHEVLNDVLYEACHGEEN
jgi:hypothetical protein